MKTRTLALFATAFSLATSAALAQTIVHQADFEDENPHGWMVNGTQMFFAGGNPGLYIGIPVVDLWGVHFINDTNPAVLGDLRRYGGDIRFSVDIRTFTLNNWFGNPMDTSDFPIVLQLYMAGGDGQVSVYLTSDPMPSQDAGWVRYHFTIPNSAGGAQLPAGWGGTGDESPTGDPALPANLTYEDVISNVVDFRLTTMQPGWFYISSFWEVGFDNVTVEVQGGSECPADWNDDGDVNSQDISAFITTWLNSVQVGNLDADFNGDGAVNSSDISAYITAWLDAVSNGC